MASILSQIASLITKIISGSGYLGVSLLMALESACIPIPSEIIMPFSGFLVASGKFAFLPLVVFGACGNLFGSIIAYVVGVYGGRKFIVRYGKYILLRKKELDKSEKFFAKHGSLSIFFGRLLPIIRTFISLPAGIAKMPFWKFCFYTFSGSLIWSGLLAYIGVLLGRNWQNIEIYFRKFDWAVGVLLVVGIIYFIYKKFSHKRS